MYNSKLIRYWHTLSQCVWGNGRNREAFPFKLNPGLSTRTYKGRANEKKDQFLANSGHIHQEPCKNNLSWCCSGSELQLLVEALWTKHRQKPMCSLTTRKKIIFSWTALTKLIMAVKHSLKCGRDIKFSWCLYNFWITWVVRNVSWDEMVAAASRAWIQRPVPLVAPPTARPVSCWDLQRPGPAELKHRPERVIKLG